MGVPAPSNAFEWAAIRDGIVPSTVTTTNRSTGAVTVSRTTRLFRESYHFRSGKSSNPIRSDGTRANSAHQRAITKVKIIPGVVTTVGSRDTTVTEGLISDVRSNVGQMNGGGLTTSFTLPWNFEEVCAEAQTKARIKLADGKSNLAVYTAESVKSSDMIANRFIALLNFYRMVRRRELREALKGTLHLKRPFNWYLEYKYGWDPLARDLYSMYEDIRTREADKMLLKVSSSASRSKEWFKEDSNGFATVEGYHRTVGRCGITAKVSSGYWNTATRYGLTDPLTVGWELVPYSFVIDWAMPVGSYFQALSATNGLTYRDGYISQTMEGGSKGVLAMPSSSVVKSSGTPAMALAAFIHNDRRTSANFPGPELYVKSPFSTSNAASASALFAQTLDLRLRRQSRR